MKQQCIDEVGRIYGRKPTDAEVQAIEQRLSRTMRELARRDPQAWLAMSADDRVLLGAKAAAEGIHAEAERKLQRQALQVIATARAQAQIAGHPGTPLEALSRMIAFHADAQGSVQSLEYRARAVEADLLRQMIGTLEATNPKFFGMIENPEGVRDLVRELHGERSGNADAAAGARQFREIADAARERFNRSGGDVGRLEDWGMPHHHSQVRVARAGQDAWRRQQAGVRGAVDRLRDTPPPPDFAREHWVQDILPALNRDRYLRDDGTRMGDAELLDVLRQVWTTIATGGLNKAEPGRIGTSMVANHGSQARQLHFKDADTFLAYQSKYGERSAYEVIVGHIKGVANDIAAVETFGPNPDQAFRLLRDQAVQQMTVENPATAGNIQKQAVQAGHMYDLAAGRTLPVASERMANFFDTLRNTLVANRLGSAVITSITDEGTMMRMAAVNNLPQVRLWANELRTMNLANVQEKRHAQRAGLALNTLVASLNRFGNDGLGAAWSSKVATATLRASGLNASTDARRRAFGVTYMSAVGQITRDVRALGDLDALDHRILLSKGITDADFQVWRRAELEDWGGGNSTMLTPDAIYAIPDARLSDLGDPQTLREQAATKLLGATLEETDMAVIEPGVRERALMRANVQRGTWGGELIRSVLLFKSFPIAMITKHWTRGMSEPGAAGRVKALAALTTSSTVLGMMALQASALRDGKDPFDMTDGRVWLSALLKGGALSIFGDFLFSNETQSGRSAVASTLGPVVSMGEEALALTWGNLLQASKGEETDFGAEAVRFARGNTPGLSAVMNLWYTRAAFDHLVMHDLQEFLSPGYLQRMQDRAYREFGQTFWWEPGGTPIDALNVSGQDFAPERAPDLEAATGGR